MTQEELDALMNEGVDSLQDDSGDTNNPGDSDEEQEDKEEASEKKESKQEYNDEEYRIDANKPWPPPPPTDDHKVVHQLDDVTRDSELKAGELFDKLESVSSIVMDMEEQVANLESNVDKDIELFEKLSKSFPHIQTFEDALERNNQSKEMTQKITEGCQTAGDEVMMAMDGMQYQDIHRQKIERVINVMRALSKYMHSLFEGQVDDDKRVGSAVHLDGDSNDNVMGSEDIEELIASLGKK